MNVETRKKSDAKAIVAVSPAMQNLRKTQTMLNHFLWSTEIAYRFILKNPEVADIPSATPAVEAFGDLIAEAWFPNVQGTIKFKEAVGTTITQIERNLPFIYRTVIAFFFAAFEDYLKDRLRTPALSAHESRSRPSQRVGWAPFYETLPRRILNPHEPICPVAIIRADICRHIRNHIIHAAGVPLPTKLDHPAVIRWRRIIEYDLSGGSEKSNFSSADISTAFNEVIGNAAREMSVARERRRDLPPEFFYALYSFTNFDELAFQIEEALISKNILPHGRIRRLRSLVRRPELIISDA